MNEERTTGIVNDKQNISFCHLTNIKCVTAYQVMISR